MFPTVPRALPKTYLAADYGGIATMLRSNNGRSWRHLSLFAAGSGTGPVLPTALEFRHDEAGRRRGKGPQVQVMRIERVVVDGNAVIGNVLPAAPKVGVG